MRLIILIVFCLTFGIVTAEDLLVADFEIANSGYTLPNSGQLSLTDYFIRTYNGNTAVTHDLLSNVQGTYYVAGRDIDYVTGDGVSGVVLLSDIDVSAHSDLQIKFLVSANDTGYESIISGWSGMDWIIGEYSYDGSNWTKFAQFTGSDLGTLGTTMKEDTNFNGQGDGTELNATFKEFTKSLPSSGPTLKIRFLLLTGSGAEDVAIDNIRVSGTVANSLPTASNGTVSLHQDSDGIVTTGDFNYSDGDSDPLNKVKCITTTSTGSLYLDLNDNGIIDGELVSANDEISKANLDLNRLKFKPVAGQSGVSYDSFTFQVNDGIAYSSSTYTMTFDVIPPPAAPQNLITVSVTSSEANISWDSVSGATYYRIYRSDDPYTGFEQINTSTTTNYQDTDVAAGNKYFYYVTADNAK